MTIKVGDTVTRVMAGAVTMPLVVTAIDDTKITCADWEFDLQTGFEIDLYFGWDGKKPSGSYLWEVTFAPDTV